MGCRTMKGWGRGKRVFYSKVNDNKKICTVLCNLVNKKDIFAGKEKKL